jgi:hypothetical protein
MAMAELPTEIYSVDVRELGSRTPAAAVLEFWWRGSIRTRDQARARFLEFIDAEGLTLAPAAAVDVELVDEFRLLRWVVRADVVTRR